MYQKQNKNRRRPHKDIPLATLTTNISHILKNINPNTSWKNTSAKFTKTVNQKPPNQPTITNQTPKRLMTEDDIDRLFGYSKSKSKSKGKGDTAIVEVVQMQTYGQEKLQGRTQLNLSSKIKTNKDFANSCKFLKIDDAEDRLMNGMNHNQLKEQDLDALFKSNETDLTADFKKKYTVGKVIGEGAYASVRVAFHKQLNRKVAIKIYQKSRLLDVQRKKSVRRQIRILQSLNHVNILKILDVVETNNHLNIITEYLEGISLNNYLKNQQNHRTSESNCKQLIRGIAQALHYLHQKQISHRDIKLDNIILQEGLNPKLIDFGFSTCIEKHKKVKLFCGTPSYMAPEIVQKKQYRGEQADIWALGVVMFIALTGIFPFKGSTDQQLYRKINYADYPKHQLYFSKQASDLVSKMLKISPEQRLTAAEVLEHPWLKKNEVKKERRTTQLQQVLKRTAISSHKSREKEHLNATTNPRRITQICPENIKNQFRIIRQSPLRINTTLCSGKIRESLAPHSNTKIPFSNDEKKKSYKVIQMLKTGLRQSEDKVKNKIRRI